MIYHVWYISPFSGTPVSVGHTAFLQQGCFCLLDIMRPARAWFLRIALSMNVGTRVCVCVSAPEAINN